MYKQVINYTYVKLYKDLSIPSISLVEMLSICKIVKGETEYRSFDRTQIFVPT